MSMISSKVAQKEPPKALTDQIFDILSRTTYATAGGVRAGMQGESIPEAAWKGLKGETKSTWADVLGDLGVEEGPTRTIAGLAGDIILDPTNIALPLAAGKIAKGMKALTKIPVIDKQLIKLMPSLAIPKEYKDLKYIMKASQRAGAGKATLQAVKRLGKLSAEDRALILRAQETGESLGPKLDPFVQAENKVMQEQAAKEVKAGVLEVPKENYAHYAWAKPKAGQTPFIREVSAKSKFNIPKQYDSLEAAVKAGATPDALVANAKRVAQGNRILASAKFLDDLTKMPDIAVDIAKAPQGWRPAAIAAEDPIKAKIAQFAFPDEIANDLEKVFAPLGADGSFEKAYDNVLNVWKSWTTATRPGFHVRNFLSNTYNMWLSGMKPRDFALATDDLLKSAETFIPRLKMTQKEFANLSADLGIVGTGHSAFQDVARTIEQEAKFARKSPLAKGLARINPASEENVLVKAGRKLGTQVEDASRLILFADRLSKGDTPTQAALVVKKYLFDYGELTNFERRYLRRLVPFYTWLRNNIPLQLESAMLHPEKLRKVATMYKAAERSGEAHSGNVEEAEKPAWFRDVGGMFRLPISKDVGFVNPGLPFLDLNRFGVPGEGFMSNIAKGARELTSVLTPAIKVPAELAANRNIYTGRELWNKDVGPTDMQRAPEIVKILPAAVQKQFGIELRRERDGSEVYYMPAAAVYLLSQSLPNLIQLGKFNMMENVGPEAPKIELPGMKVDPDILGTLTGLRGYLLTPEQRRRTQLQLGRSQRSGANRQRRGTTRTVEAEDNIINWIRSNLGGE